MRKTSVVGSIVLSLLLLIVLLNPAWSDVIYVSKDGSNGHGRSWAAAKTTVQAGINTAFSGDEVWVAKGTYQENISLKSGVALYGGFIGNETDRIQRDWSANITTLDGRKLNNVIIIPDGVNNTTRVDGFTICNGRGPENTYQGYGSAIYCWNGSPIIANNIITQNTGSICIPVGSPVITNNQVVRSSEGIICSLHGGAATISHNYISRNSDGVWVGGDTVVSDNIIAYNNIYGCSPNSEDGTVTVRNNYIVGSLDGIYCRGSATITDNVVVSSGQYGIYCNGGKQSILNNTVAYNGPSFANGGGILLCYYSTALVANNIVAFNYRGFEVYSGSIMTPRRNCVYPLDSNSYVGRYIDLHAGPDDFFVDPLFIDASHGNYHLRWNSPCINAGWTGAPGLPEFDFDGQDRICWEKVDVGADEYWPLQVKIDIKPGEPDNYLNPRSKGLVLVAVLSTAEFDATRIDTATVKFAGAGVASRGNGQLHCFTSDVNGDSLLDLLMYFQIENLILPTGTADLTLTGKVLDGDYIEGSDSIILSAKN